MYGIKDIIGWEIKDGNGNIVMSGSDLGGLSLRHSSKLSNQEKLNPDNIKKVIFNPPATIVIFKDDTKTVVKSHNEDFDPEKGVLMALARHIWDSRADFNRFMEKWTVEGNDKK